MGKLFINEEGFIDLRRNPPATRVQVQGGIESPEPVAAVDVVAEPPAVPKEEALPAIQKTAEGLDTPVAPVVKVRAKKSVVLKRIDSMEGERCYAIVSQRKYDQMSQYRWIGVRTGHMFRRVVSANGVETIIWFHREAASCNRADKFVAFLDGDERNCHHSNTRIVATKEEAKAIRQRALERKAYGKA